MFKFIDIIRAMKKPVKYPAPVVIIEPPPLIVTEYIHDERNEALQRLVLNGKIEISDVPYNLRVNDNTFYLYAIRFAKARVVTREQLYRIRLLLKEDIQKEKEKAGDAYDMDSLSSLNHVLESYEHVWENPDGYVY